MNHWRRLKASKTIVICLMGLTTGIILIYWGNEVVLRQIGSYLVTDEDLRPASMIIILGGGLPFSAIEGARLYRDGWAAKVVLTRTRKSEGYYALKRLGIESKVEYEYNYEVLLRSGVPEKAILVIEPEVENTLSELRTILRVLQPDKRNDIIIVTSKIHTKRTSAIWRHLSSDSPRIIVRYPPRDAFDASRWWKNRQLSLSVVREYLGLANYWLGFPMG